MVSFFNEATTIAIASDDPNEKETKPFANEVQDTIMTLDAVLNTCEKIQSSIGDPEATAELYFEMTKNYQDTAALQISWLESLTQLHISQENWVETAMCYLHQCLIIGDLLQSFNELELAAGTFVSSMGRVAPTLKAYHEKISNASRSSLDMQFQQCQLINPDSFFHLLFESMQIFKQITAYELAIDVGRLLATIYQGKRNFPEAIKVFQELHDLCVETSEMERSKQSRAFGKYFLVSFYGVKWGSLHKHSFVYKESNNVTAQSLFMRLKSQFEVSNDIEPVPLSPLKQLQLRELDSSKRFIQVAPLDVFFDPLERSKRITQFSRQFNVNEFIVDTMLIVQEEGESLFGEHRTRDRQGSRPESPAPSGVRSRRKATGVDPMKRKTVITVEHSFPFPLKRLKVISKRPHTTTVVDGWSERVEKHIRDLSEAICRKPPLISDLQTCLTAALLSDESSEIVAYLRGVVDPDLQEHAALLKKSLRSLSKLADMAVTLHKSIIDVSHLALESQFEEGLRKLNANVGSL